jgi:hypothetical protein
MKPGLPKPDKDTKEGNYRPNFLMMNINAKTMKIFANQIQQHFLKKIIYHGQVGFIPEHNDDSTSTNQ